MREAERRKERGRAEESGGGREGGRGRKREKGRERVPKMRGRSTFTVQLPLLQLTYAKYMKVHDTKQQLLGFPIFRRGAN